MYEFVSYHMSFELGLIVNLLIQERSSRSKDIAKYDFHSKGFELSQ
jgi:hypothetical protein